MTNKHLLPIHILFCFCFIATITAQPNAPPIPHGFSLARGSPQPLVLARSDNAATQHSTLFGQNQFELIRALFRSSSSLSSSDQPANAFSILDRSDNRPPIVDPDTGNSGGQQYYYENTSPAMSLNVGAWVTIACVALAAIIGIVVVVRYLWRKRSQKLEKSSVIVNPAELTPQGDFAMNVFDLHTRPTIDMTNDQMRVGVSLPPNWDEYYDATSGMPYYHNRITKQTVWEIPAAEYQQEGRSYALSV